ncbi:TetR family transcriptional regulator [Cnuibacter physcomitrellae]|uniref:TetR family transcriptional regulator n=1 Tax=Cnuibacter physcomitrellae TaxID=1619308 RepID=A0A1X9LMT7_9MICO|nr:TetR/AcrR family transcriptional regulator [Cnuibacter physcomitrellae]ARJ04429.1 TetR family transcriptional regulator [Cnuibacter physcomitrellae]GGI41032.1 TetR family transcriptional regulator [Cnuibacter physcomitrellae]
MAQPAEPVSRRSRPSKDPLSRQAIVGAAQSLIRERGVDAVALRHVAERVETGPASLYAYFGSRDILLEHVLGAVYAEVELVDAGGGERGWREALAGTVGNTIETLGRYPGLGAVALGSIPTLPGALRLAEHELSLMEAGGVPEERAALAVDLLAQFAASSAVERGVRRDRPHDDVERRRVRTAYEAADADLFPRVARAAALLTGPDDRSRRDFALQAIITGIQGTRRP